LKNSDVLFAILVRFSFAQDLNPRSSVTGESELSLSHYGRL